MLFNSGNKLLLPVVGVSLVLTFLSPALFADTTVVNPAFNKVDIQRVHDDDAAVTCWVLYVPGTAKGTTFTSDSYSISCLPNSVINPKASDK